MKSYLFSIASLVMFASFNPGCDWNVTPPVSSSGVSKATVSIPTGADGLTAEQRNIKDRLTKDNEPGSIKHLYVISTYSGQTLIYSTVRGKVTSGGKRLTPGSVNYVYNPETSSNNSGFPIVIGNRTAVTSEVLQDDGTYGSSMDYLFWFDSKGIYHQHYVQGGQIVHVSSEPLSVRGVVINMELAKQDETVAAPTPTLPAKTTK